MQSIHLGQYSVNATNSRYRQYSTKNRGTIKNHNIKNVGTKYTNNNDSNSEMLRAKIENNIILLSGIDNNKGFKTKLNRAKQKHIRGNSTEEKDNKHPPPLGIKLRRKVNVIEDNRCEEVELLRQVNDLNDFQGPLNKSYYFTCQEKVTSNLKLGSDHNQTFEICLCREDNERCTESAIKMSIERLEKGKLSLQNSITKKHVPYTKNTAEKCCATPILFLFVLMQYYFRHH